MKFWMKETIMYLLTFAICTAVCIIVHSLAGLEEISTPIVLIICIGHQLIAIISYIAGKMDRAQ